MDLNGCMTLIIILTLTVGLVLEQLNKWQRRGDSESTLRTGDASGVENEALRRDSESTLRTGDASGVENEALRVENEALRRDSESTLRTGDASGVENEALRRDSELTSIMDDTSGEQYDVFLSFRGPDTGKSFADILYRDMVRLGRVFFADKELKDGGKIDVLLKAVRNSRIYIPIFSQQFAESVWCLREVERMVECLSTPNEKKQIIPIFFDVKPDDVKLKTDLYKQGLRNHLGKYDSSQVQKWEKALRTVGGRRGREIQGKSQAEEIDSIVEVVSAMLRTGHVAETENLVEDIAQVQSIIKKLDFGSDGVRYIGITGVGGIGKTTLATNVYNKLRSHFQGCAFLPDVRVHWQSHDGVLNLQKKLLSHFVSSVITDQITDDSKGMEMIKKVLSTKNVLIFLDDLDKKEQLEKLAGKYDWFGSPSRIIFTTRNREVLTTGVELSDDEPKRISEYEVESMAPDQARELFSKHAFAGVSSLEGCKPFAEEIIRKVGGYPLSIRVIGSHIRGLGFAGESPEIQEKLLEETSQRLDDFDFDEIRKALSVSYDGLGEKEKEVFLDIACFFSDEDQTYPFIMWNDCKYRPHSATRVLQQQSLIKIMGKKLWMHEEVQNFGRYITRKVRSPEFSRAWERDDVVQLLKGKERNEGVEALSLTSSDGSHKFSFEELAALPKLRFLRAKGSYFYGDSDNGLLNLRWLSWQTWGTTFQAKNFRFSELVVLDLSDSDIEHDWSGWSQMKVTEKLKVLDLTGCTKLTRTPDFSNFTSLESLILARCPKLVTIDCSIGKIKRLKTLNIMGCSSLEELPEEIGSLHFLTKIIMPQNFQQLKLPEGLGKLESLSSFILDKHPRIGQLPDSIGGMVKLTRLSLVGCVGIKELPCSIGQLKMLQKLDVSKSGITKFPPTIGGVVMLQELHATECRDLTDENLKEIGKLSHLRVLDLSYTSVATLPDVISGLSHLQELQLGSPVLRQVPALPSSLTRLVFQAIDFSFLPDLSKLDNLDYLEFYGLSALENDQVTRTAARPEEDGAHLLPSHLSTLKLTGFTPRLRVLQPARLSVLHVAEFPLRLLSVSKFQVSHLTELKISGCKYREEILDLSHMKNLRRLVLARLNWLVTIQGFSTLESLEYFCLSRCPSIKELPNLSKLSKLQHLVLEGFLNLSSIQGVEGLENWDFDGRGRNVLKRCLDVSRTTWVHHSLPLSDVYISSCQTDIDLNTGYLSRSLVGHQIIVCGDDSASSSGDEIRGHVQQVIDVSHIYIPIFSKSYAHSQRCLRELVHMVKCWSESEGKRRIIPIFYDVEISDVELESNLYRSALDGHRPISDSAEVKSWEEALIQVAHIEGFNLKANGYEDLVKNVTEEVLKARQLLDVNS